MILLQYGRKLKRILFRFTIKRKICKNKSFVGILKKAEHCSVFSKKNNSLSKILRLLPIKMNTFCRMSDQAAAHLP